jgi:hypothetical protein
VLSEKLLQAAININRIREASPRAHAYRIKLAKRTIDLLNDFIATEVQAAVSEPKGHPAKMTWEQIGQALNLSKSASFTKYGANHGDPPNPN